MKLTNRQNLTEVYIDHKDLTKGLLAYQDTTKAPWGSARLMKNMWITDRGGIAPRPGTRTVGDVETSSNFIRGFYTFKKSQSTDEIMLKALGTKLLAYSKKYSDQGWFKIKDNFESGKEFGFTTSLVNTDNEDYVVFCNRYNNYMRWRGNIAKLTASLSGGETSVTVDSTLTSEIFYSGTATGNSATTITVSGANWAVSQWVNLYVHIVGTGKVRKITANTSDTLTFDTLGAGPGNVAFQIRKIAFPATGTLIYNNTEIAYTGIDTSTKFTVSSAHAAPINTLLTNIPDEYPSAPRGNRFANYLTRIIVGNVRSGLARDSGGSLQGWTSAGSAFVSKQLNPFDFGYTATRVPGEGDVIATPYGGGDITDVVAQEDKFYIFKKDYIESDSYSQDANDLVIRDPLKAEVGSVGRVIKGPDDIYFVTKDNQITSIGRVQSKDLRPETENIGMPIKRLLDSYSFGQGFGIYFKNRIFIPTKSNADATNNDIVIVYNVIRKAFEGIWDIAAFGFTEFDGKLYYAESNGGNVYEMFTENSDFQGDDKFNIPAEFATNFYNLASSHGAYQAMNGVYVEGYIKANTEVTFKLYSDFSDEEFLSFNFAGTEDAFVKAEGISAYLGGTPLGLRPFGTIGEAGNDGRRPFYFKLYFPFQYGRYFSFGFASDGDEYDYEISKFGFLMQESVSADYNKVKGA